MLCRNPCACHTKSTLNLKKWPETLVFFNDFAFQIALATAWCKFWRLELPIVLRACQFLTILTFESLSRHSAVQILATSWAAVPPHPPVFRSWLSQPAKPQNYGKHSVSRNSYLANLLISHISAVSHLRGHISWLTDLQRLLKSDLVSSHAIKIDGFQLFVAGNQWQSRNHQPQKMCRRSPSKSAWVVEVKWVNWIFASRMARPSPVILAKKLVERHLRRGRCKKSAFHGSCLIYSFESNRFVLLDLEPENWSPGCSKFSFDESTWLCRKWSQWSSGTARNVIPRNHVFRIHLEYHPNPSILDLSETMVLHVFSPKNSHTTHLKSHPKGMSNISGSKLSSRCLILSMGSSTSSTKIIWPPMKDQDLWAVQLWPAIGRFCKGWW